MGIVVVLIVAAIAWAVWKGNLSRQQVPPILLGLAGAFLAARGNLIIGVAAIGIAVTWYRGLSWRLFSTRAIQSDPNSIDKARFILGVSQFDNEESIRNRHRALIARNHPDTGGTDERAKELNEARDLLLRDLKNKPR